MKRREREEEGEREKEVFLGFFWVFFLFMLLSDEYDRSFLSLPFFFFGVCVFVLCIVFRMPTLPPFFLILFFHCGLCVLVVVGGTKFKLMGLWYHMVWFMQTMADYDIYFF